LTSIDDIGQEYVTKCTWSEEEPKMYPVIHRVAEEVRSRELSGFNGEVSKEYHAAKGR